MALTRLNNQALTSITSAGLPTGSMLQVLSNTLTTDIYTTSTSFTSTGLAQAITPISTSSKILCFISVGSWYINAGGYAICTLYRGSTNIGDGNDGIMTIQQVQSERSPATHHILDSPSTTSATTYTVYIRSNGGESTYVSYSSYGHFTLTLMEIAG